MSAYFPPLASFPPPTLSDHPSLDVVLWGRHLCQGRFPRALRVRACAAQPGRLLLGHGVGGGASAPDTTFPSHARSSWAGGGGGNGRWPVTRAPEECFPPKTGLRTFQKNRRRASPATTGEKSAVAAALRWPGTAGRGGGEVSRRVGGERRRAATVAQAARRPVGACPPPADVDTRCLQQTCWRMFGSLYTVRRNCTARHWWRRRRPA